MGHNRSRTLCPLLGTGSNPEIKVIVLFSQTCPVVDGAHWCYVLLARLRAFPTAWGARACSMLLAALIYIDILPSKE